MKQMLLGIGHQAAQVCDAKRRETNEVAPVIALGSCSRCIPVYGKGELRGLAGFLPQGVFQTMARESPGVLLS